MTDQAADPAVQGPPVKNGHGGARAGAGRPKGPLPPPIREQARAWVVATFENSQIGFELRLSAAIALMLEPDPLGLPALDRIHGRSQARLKALARVEVTQTPTFRQAVAALNLALQAYEPETEPGATGDQ